MNLATGYLLQTPHSYHVRLPFTQKHRCGDIVSCCLSRVALYANTHALNLFVLLRPTAFAGSTVTTPAIHPAPLFIHKFIGHLFVIKQNGRGLTQATCRSVKEAAYLSAPSAGKQHNKITFNRSESQCRYFRKCTW